MKKLTINGQAIHFVDQGVGANLLLVHGFPLDHSMWRFQVAELSQHRRVICPDLPGFGSSSLGHPAISMRQMADDLVALLDELQIERVSFCGLSMGGYIGWQFCRHYPERLERLVACDTRAKNDSEVVSRGRQMMARAVREQGSDPVAADMVPKLFSADSLEHQPDVVERIRTSITSVDPESIALGQLAMADRPDATDWLPEIRVPSLFVVGQHDQITPPEEMRGMADLVSDSQVAEIANAGHLPPLENPTEFNRELIKFINR